MTLSRNDDEKEKSNNAIVTKMKEIEDENSKLKIVFEKSEIEVHNLNKETDETKEKVREYKKEIENLMAKTMYINSYKTHTPR